MDEIVAEPELAIQLSKSEFIVAPIDGEILPRQSVISSTLNHLPHNTTDNTTENKSRDGQYQLAIHLIIIYATTIRTNEDIHPVLICTCKGPTCRHAPTHIDCCPVPVYRPPTHKSTTGQTLDRWNRQEMLGPAYRSHVKKKREMSGDL